MFQMIILFLNQNNVFVSTISKNLASTLMVFNFDSKKVHFLCLSDKLKQNNNFILFSIILYFKK
jgi:hypothetical protein